jgi:tetratricopeptide (TPR) repeat protein
MNVAQTLKEQGDFAEAKRVGQRALESAVAQQDSARVAFFQSVLGDIERALGDPAAAKACYESALAIFERLADRSSVARTKIDLAALVFEQGEERNGHEILGGALMSFRDLGNRRGIARAIDELALFALRQGRPERALRLGGAAVAIRRAVGASLHNSERTRLERRLDAARTHLGTAAAAAEAEGRSMTIESAVDYALRVARGATRS